MTNSLSRRDALRRLLLASAFPFAASIYRRAMATTSAAANKSIAPVSVKDFGARGNGTTDDAHAIQSALDSLSSDGGGHLHFPAGHYNISRQLTPRSNVRVFGEGRQSHIICTAHDGPSNVFFNDGVLPAYYEHYSYCALTDIAAGQRTLRFLNPREVSQYAGGGLAVIRSAAHAIVGSDTLPHFVELVKIVSVNLAAGTVDLEDPILISVHEPKITKTRRSSDLIENFTIESMSLEAVGAGAACLRLRSVYRGQFKNLFLRSDEPFLGNAITKSLAENIQIEFRSRFLEWKTGAYASTFRNIHGVIYGAREMTFNALSVGEYARNLTFDGFSVDLRDSVLRVPAISNARTTCSPLLIRNGKLRAKAVYGVLRIVDGDGVAPHDMLIEDIAARVGLFGRGIELISWNREKGLALERLVIRDISIDGVNGNPINSDAAYGIGIQTNLEDVEITGCNIPGPVRVDNAWKHRGVLIAKNTFARPRPEGSNTPGVRFENNVFTKTF